MTTLKQMVFASLFVFALLSTSVAQESTNSPTQRTTLTITAAVAGDRVRITAPSSVVQMHVEVYAASGEKLFDQEIRGGNVFDWHLQDGQAQRLAPGTYVFVVTAKSVSGKLTQKIGTVSVEEKSANVHPAESPQLSAAQAQTIGPVEENSSWTIAAKNEPQTGTVIANDGIDGQMIRGRGALSFRIGDFFRGVDKEQMRLTEAGNLGIGTSEPKGTLDVAGTIRAQRFLVAKPNRPASDLKAQAPDDVDSAQPLASGSGTQDRIAKWTDNAGTLGDSSITETGGNVGIGTTTPGSKLVVSANSATLPPASGVARFADADGGQTAVFADAFSNNAIFNVRRANGTAAVPSALQANQLIGVTGASGYGASAYMGTRARVAFWASEMWTNTANGTYLTFNTTANGAATPGGTERLRIDNAGNVGIGTTNPTERLYVVGNGLFTGNLTVNGTLNANLPAGSGNYIQNTTVQQSGNFNITGDGTVGGTLTGNAINSTTHYRIGGSVVLSVSGGHGGSLVPNTNTFTGIGAGASTIPDGFANFNSFFGHSAGQFNVSGIGNSYFGYGADGGSAGSDNTAIGFGANVANGLSNATVIGAGANVAASNSLVLGNGANVGIGTSAPLSRLHVVGNSIFATNGTNGVRITPVNDSDIGVLNVTNAANSVNWLTVGSNGQVIMNGPGRVGIGTTTPDQKLSVLGNASKFGGGSWEVYSDERLKNVRGKFRTGLKAVMQLQPIRYEYKPDNALNLKMDGEFVGFSAQAVERVIPEAVTTNDKGYLLVNNDPILWTMLNAIKEQQSQIEQQHQQIEALKKLVCRAHPRAKACQ